VRVVMTAGARAFVAPLTFQAVSGEPVHGELLDADAEAGMGHIELARWADLVLVAPASADFMARLSAGLADDLLATLCLATAAPIALAPAMNHRMWSNPATRDNAELLVRRGVALFGPGIGDQACGESGPGRMLEPIELVDQVEGRFAVASAWRGRRVLVTAGPTYEDVDPVRFIGNRSSGRMGFAIAAEAAMRGAEVTLVAGPVHRSTPAGVERVDVRSARDMHAAVMERAGACDIFVAAAAVADFRPREAATEKLKKGEARELSLALERNPDILAAVCALEKGRPLAVGFAAETDNVVEYARAKLEAKGADMICANVVGAEQGGFDATQNALEVLYPGGQVSIPMLEKHAVARRLLDLIEAHQAKEGELAAHG